jgi:hypothetical protein
MFFGTLNSFLAVRLTSDFSTTSYVVAVDHWSSGGQKTWFFGPFLTAALSAIDRYTVLNRYEWDFSCGYY